MEEHTHTLWIWKSTLFYWWGSNLCRFVILVIIYNLDISQYPTSGYTKLLLRKCLYPSSIQMDMSEKLVKIIILTFCSLCPSVLSSTGVAFFWQNARININSWRDASIDKIKNLYLCTSVLIIDKRTQEQMANAMKLNKINFCHSAHYVLLFLSSPGVAFFLTEWQNET